MKKYLLLLVAVAACTDPFIPEPGQLEACQAQTTDLDRYGSPGQGFIGSLHGFAGPCVGSIYDFNGNDLVRPTRMTGTFDDLSTGGITTVRWVGGEIVSVVYD